MAVLDLTGREVDIALLGVAAGVLWLAAAAFLYASRHPPEPEVGPRTLELGPEPPAVANLLVHDWRVSADAVAATLIDLAARRVLEMEQRGPGVFYVRLRSRHAEEERLTAYERRVLEHVRGLASDGVVPAEALTTGPGEVSKSWRRDFDREVVDDAKRRGLSRDAIEGWMITALTLASGLPALAAIALSEFQVAFVIVVAAISILGWIRSRYPQRETPAGLAAASRWLGVRAELAENEVFATYSPLTVPLWDRLLAYGAALGVARGASGPLPMGEESDTHAWSSFGGRWRPVRVSYPRLWPLAWGAEPLVALVGGVGSAVVGGLVLNWIGAQQAEAAGGGWSSLIALATLAVPCAAVLFGIAVAVMAVQDQWTTVEITGPVLRLRTFGDDEDPRHYAAVDDGRSRAIRAWRLSPLQYGALRQGQLVRVVATRNLGRVRSLEDASDTSLVLTDAV